MTIQQALETIHQKIQDATQLAHRPESAVTLLAVSKTKPNEAILEALADFQGAGRRFDQLGEFIRPNGKVRLVDDYGHHPTEVGVTIKAAREGWEINVL